MSWTEVAERLSAARTYWLGTTSVSGAPHAAPVWGVVTGGTLYLYSERSTIKARNLAVDPRVVIHLESGEDVLIVHGAAEDLGSPADVPPVVAALTAKYTAPQDRQYLPDADPGFDVVYALRPRSALAWRLDDYEASQRRWSFGTLVSVTATRWTFPRKREPVLPERRSGAPAIRAGNAGAGPGSGLDP